MLRRIFGLKREKVSGGWTRLRNVELHKLHASPNIMVIKSRRMRLAGQVARIEYVRRHTIYSLGNLKEGDYLEDIDVDGKIILVWILGK